jgi:hypothetical protein
MRKKTPSLSSWLVLALGLAAAAALQATPAPKEFSADLAQEAQNGQKPTGKIYVGDERTGMVMSQQG